MKRLLFFLLMPFIFTIATTSGFTQQTTTLKCGEEGVFDLGNGYRINYTDSTSTPGEAAFYLRAKFRNKKFKCNTEDCPWPGEDQCKVGVIFVEEPVPVEASTKWLFTGEITWSCTTCEEGSTEQDNSDSQDHQRQETTPLQSDDEPQNHVDVLTNDKLAIIKKVYPNPTSEIVQIDLQINQEGGNKVEIQIIDVSGRMLLKRNYADIPSSLFNAKLDLSDLPKGIYFPTIYVNGNRIGSSKISIQ